MKRLHRNLQIFALSAADLCSTAIKEIQVVQQKNNIGVTIPVMTEQNEANKKESKEPETYLNDNVLHPRLKCVTNHTARRIGITNMYLSHKYDIFQMMHVSGHKTQKTFMDYISPACRLRSKNLSSDEIADEIDAIVNANKGEIF